MDRLISSNLGDWLTQKGRKPLILRGARQVGKTWLIRDLAKRHGLDLLEFNFERNPEYRKHFSTNNPRQIVDDLSLVLGRSIQPQRSLLLLDEIQAAGEILGKLRWFAEELPELAVIAAGSLLEFTLQDHEFSMPVGRVTFRHMEPLGFQEYLQAHGQDALLKSLSAWRPGDNLTAAAHEQAWLWFERFSMVGGMPEVAAADVGGASPGKCRELQKDLMAAFRADFPKYTGRLHADILDTVLRAVAGSIGRKFVYAQADAGLKQHQVKRALELLTAARVCSLVRYSAGNGLPLGAETKDTFRKTALLDVGLLHALLNTPAAASFPAWAALPSDFRSRISEQMTAQQLRLLDPAGTEEPELHYWQREGGRPGEIDYLAAVAGRIIPIELKSGAAGSMKSLHQFMHDKKLSLAVRCDANPPSDMQVDMATTLGDPARYRLISLPLYLLWNLPRILPDIR
jgi:predicted AAA+ superfamily ATPase